MVTRLVGFLEYGQALRNLDELLNRLTSEELHVVDQMVAERAEFTVYTNLSRHLQTSPSTLATTVTSSGDERRGLAWVMALARIELAAMLAGFTGTPQPFEVVGPSRFELAAYKELLADGARAHYWGLQRDPALRAVTRMSPKNTAVLSYSRRLVIARAMLRATVKAGLSEYSPQQLSELASWQESLDSLQAGLIAKIELYLRGDVARSTTRSKRRHVGEYGAACGALLRAERREINAGTAKVFSYEK